MGGVTHGVAQNGYSGAMIRETRSQAKGVPQFVAAQIAGVLGGLVLGLQDAPPSQPKFCDAGVTRC